MISGFSRVHEAVDFWHVCRVRASPAVLVVLCWACEASFPPEGPAWLVDYGLEPSPTDTSVTHLSWQAPGEECLQSYRITVTYDHNPPKEKDSVSTLTIGPPRQPAAGPAPPRILSEGAIFEGRLYYDPMLFGEAGTERDMLISASLVGPAAPTAACLPRTWDPMDDALALGWPRLPARPVALGEHWRGARVEGRCNRTACVDPQTYMGGKDNHDRSCATMGWDEQLVGILEVGDERLAAVESHWSDGHPLVSAKRRVLISVDHGRPVWAKVVIDHRPPQLGDDNTYAPIERSWTMESIDSCPGSLGAAGWQLPDDVVEASARAKRRFHEEEKERRMRATKERRLRREGIRNERSEGGDERP
jgi:hypothetical protein